MIYSTENEEAKVREALELIKGYDTFLEYRAYELGYDYLPEKVECNSRLTLEEIERLDPREIERVMVAPPEYEQFAIMPGIINKRWTTGPKVTIVLYEFSPTLAKLRFKHFMNDDKVRSVFPDIKWTIRQFHDFVRINLNNYPSSVMALRKLDPEKITGFDVEKIPPRYGESHRMKVEVFTKEEA